MQCLATRKRTLQQTEDAINSKFLAAIESITAEPKAEETEGSLFGKMIGQRLDKLEPKKRAQAQMDIQAAMFKHEFE